MLKVLIPQFCGRFKCLNKIEVLIIFTNLVWAVSGNIFGTVRRNYDFLNCCKRACGKYVPEKRYIDGALITNAQWPWLVGILKEGWPLSNPNAPLCYGVLISDRHVLTTTSCVLKKKPYDIVVYFYGDFPSKVRRHRTVEDIDTHRDYSRTNHDNNLAILTLALPIDLENTRGKNNQIYPICIPNPFLFSGRINKMTGIMTKRQSFNTVLVESPAYHFGSVPAKIYGARNPLCSNIFSERPKEKNLCQELKGHCYGDEGSPLTIMLSETGRPISSGGRFYVLGIYSKGYGCDGYQTGKSGVDVSTNIMNHTDWIIQKTIRDGNFCS